MALYGDCDFIGLKGFYAVHKFNSDLRSAPEVLLFVGCTLLWVLVDLEVLVRF